MGTLTGAAQAVAANKQRGRSVAAGIRKMREKADMQLKFLKVTWYRPTPIRRLRSVFGHPWHGLAPVKFENLTGTQRLGRGHVQKTQDLLGGLSSWRTWSSLTQ